MSKLIIYKIYEIENQNQFYIGSTNRFSSRKSHHKKNVKNKVGKLYWCKLYSYIRQQGGWDKFQIIKIEEVEGDKDALRRKEQEYITNLKPPLNSINSIKEIII